MQIPKISHNDSAFLNGFLFIYVFCEKVKYECLFQFNNNFPPL